MMIATIRIEAMMLIEPVRTSSNNPPIALGRPAAIPPKMMIEMPLPRPRSVICSPSHIRNIVPVTSVITAVTRNIRPGSSTVPLRLQCDRDRQRPEGGRDHRAVARVLRDLPLPCCPSFFSASNCGSTIVSNRMMIDAEMYGMMPSAKTVKRDSAPPENRLNIPRMPPD